MEDKGEKGSICRFLFEIIGAVSLQLEKDWMSAECVYSGFKSTEISIADWHHWAPSALTAAETSVGTVTRLEISHTPLIQIRITSGFFNCWNGFTIHGKCFFFFFSPAFQCFHYKSLVKYVLSVLPKYCFLWLMASGNSILEELFLLISPRVLFS